MYVKQINFDLSPYYMRYFVENVSQVIIDTKNNIDNINNCLNIEDLEKVINKGFKVVFKRCVLIKVYNTKVKYTYNDKVMYDKKDEFIDNMPDTDFCIETENRTHIIINKTNIYEITNTNYRI